MKLSDKIIKLSSELEVHLRRAEETINGYAGYELDDATLSEAAEAALFAAGEIDGSSEIDGVIGALQSIGD